MGREANRIDATLRWLCNDIEELTEVLAEFEELSEAEQDKWLYEWPNEMAILEDDLEAPYRAGEMNAEQERLYAELKAKLRELAPAIKHTLELRVPPSVFT